MGSTGHKQVKPIVGVPESPLSKRPLALAFLKNVLDRFELTVQVKEHKVKTAPAGERQDTNG